MARKKTLTIKKFDTWDLWDKNCSTGTRKWVPPLNWWMSVCSSFLSKCRLSRAAGVQQRNHLLIQRVPAANLRWTYPGTSPCRCLHLDNSLYSGWPHSAPLKSQASSSTSSLLSHWPNSVLHSRKQGDTVHLHKDKITSCAAVCNNSATVPDVACWSLHTPDLHSAVCFGPSYVLNSEYSDCKLIVAAKHATKSHLKLCLEKCKCRPTWDDGIRTAAIDQNLPFWTDTSGTRRVEQTHKVTKHPQAWIWGCEECKNKPRWCQVGIRWGKKASTVFLVFYFERRYFLETYRWIGLHKMNKLSSSVSVVACAKNLPLSIWSADT